MKWREQVDGLKIPFAPKRALRNELDQHFAHSEEESESFTPDELAEFEDIHNTWIYKSPHKSKLETAITLIPLAALMTLITKETLVLEFMKEGGPGMILIVVIAAALLIRELMLATRVLISKDHAKLRVDSTSTLISALALTIIGVLGTCSGLYLSAQAGASHPDIFIEGFKESMTCVIVASAGAALVLLMHFATRRMLMIWSAPTETYQ